MDNWFGKWIQRNRVWRAISLNDDHNLLENRARLYVMCLMLLPLMRNAGNAHTINTIKQSFAVMIWMYASKNMYKIKWGAWPADSLDFTSKSVDNFHTLQKQEIFYLHTINFFCNYFHSLLLLSIECEVVMLYLSWKKLKMRKKLHFWLKVLRYLHLNYCTIAVFVHWILWAHFETHLKR